MKYQQRSEARAVSEGSVQLPGDFAERLLGLKERAGLTWEEMAWELGIDSRQLQRWRRGASPSGPAMLSLVRLAARVPDGIFEIAGDDLMILLSGERSS